MVAHDFVLTRDPRVVGARARRSRFGATPLRAAVTAATRAFESWTLAPRARGRSLLKIADILKARTEEVARTIALEAGNAFLPQARSEACRAADAFRYGRPELAAGASVWGGGRQLQEIGRDLLDRP